MEYFPSHTLADELQGDIPLDIKRGIKIIFDVCRGISVAHQLNIVHRDLKPLNILINDQSISRFAHFEIRFRELTQIGQKGSTPTPGNFQNRSFHNNFVALRSVAWKVFSGLLPADFRAIF
jgi:serine/threonine protein kinase